MREKEREKKEREREREREHLVGTSGGIRYAREYM